MDLNFEITQDGAFPLLLVCAAGDLEILNLMLSNPTIKMNKTDKHGVSAFFMAAFHGNLNVMKRLVEAGAEIHNKNSTGSNVLHVAVKRDNLKVVRELISMKYPLDEPKVNGITPRAIAGMRGNL